MGLSRRLISGLLVVGAMGLVMAQSAVHPTVVAAAPVGGADAELVAPQWWSVAGQAALGRFAMGLASSGFTTAGGAIGAVQGFVEYAATTTGTATVYTMATAWTNTLATSEPPAAVSEAAALLKQAFDH